MAKTYAGSVVLAPFLVAGGTTTKAAPAKTAGPIDMRVNYGTGITIAVTNGSSAPGAAMQAQVQVSYDGATWRDYGAPMAGDVAANSSYSWSVDLPKQWGYAQVIFWGNTTNAVTVAVETEACTGL